MPSYDIGPRIGIEGEKEFRNAIKAIDSEVRALTNEIKTLCRRWHCEHSTDCPDWRSWRGSYHSSGKKPRKRFEYVVQGRARTQCFCGRAR